MTSTKEIDISKFDGWPSPSQYNSASSFSPMQFSEKGDRLLISLIYEDEMEGVSYWTKFLGYNLETGELEELIKIDGTSISFWYLVNENEIIGISGQVLVKLDLDKANYDTLFDYKYYPQPLEVLTSESSIDFVIEARQNLSVLELQFKNKIS